MAQRLWLGGLVAGVGVLGHAAVGVGVGVFVAQPPVEELAPRVYRLARPYPEAGRDAHDQAHKVLEHEHGIVRRRRVVRAQARARALPPLAEVLLVEVAGDDDGGRDGVEHGEDPDPDHQPLQLVRLASALLLDDATDAEEADEAGEEEGGADDEVDEKRRQHETAQVLQALVAHEADAGDGVAVHRGHGQHGDGLDGGNEPGGQVEVLRVGGDGLLAPLQPGRQEPGEGEDDPPDGRRHAEEVDEEEDHGADGGSRGLVANHARLAGYALVPHDEPDDVADGHHEVAGGEEDDGPLRVLEALHVHEEGGDGHGGGDAAQDGPQADPEGGESALIVAEVRTEAVDGAVGHASRGDLVVVAVGVLVHGHQRRVALTPTVPLRGPRWQTKVPGPTAMDRLHAMVRPRPPRLVLLGVDELSPSSQRRSDGGRLVLGVGGRGLAVRGVGVHAQVVLVAVLGQLVAVHLLGPGKAVLPHEGRAARLGPFTNRPTGRQVLLIVGHADGGVHAAQEELEVWRALDLHQGPELVHLQPRLVLRLVVELVGHVGVVVADAFAHGDGDLLAPPCLVPSLHPRQHAAHRHHHHRHSGQQGHRP